MACRAGELLGEDIVSLRNGPAIALLCQVTSEPRGIPRTAWPGLRRSVWANQVVGKLTPGTAPNVM